MAEQPPSEPIALQTVGLVVLLLVEVPEELAAAEAEIKVTEELEHTAEVEAGEVAIRLVQVQAQLLLETAETVGHTAAVEEAAELCGLQLV